MKNVLTFLFIGLMIAFCCVAVANRVIDVDQGQVEYTVSAQDYQVVFASIDTGPQLVDDYGNLSDIIYMIILALIGVVEVVLRIYPSAGDNTILGNVLKFLLWLSNLFNRNKPVQRE
jgi:hypothetical protein